MLLQCKCRFLQFIHLKRHFSNKINHYIFFFLSIHFKIHLQYHQKYHPCASSPPDAQPCGPPRPPAPHHGPSPAPGFSCRALPTQLSPPDPMADYPTCPFGIILRFILGHWGGCAAPAVPAWLFFRVSPFLLSCTEKTR